MSDNAVVKNRNQAPFVDEELPAGDSDIFAGHFLQRNGSDKYTKNSTEAASGRGLMADLDRTDPSQARDDGYDSDDRVSAVRVPVGGKVVGRLAAGGDLTTAANANVSKDDLLVETTTGALANHDSAETSGDPEGAVYRALEAVDNSGASAGVSNQAYIEVVRVA